MRWTLITAVALAGCATNDYEFALLDLDEPIEFVDAGTLEETPPPSPYSFDLSGPSIAGPGDTVTLTAAAGLWDVVLLLGSPGEGTGPCAPPMLGGVCTDVILPVSILGQGRADVQGVATFEVALPQVPASWSFQAIAHRGPNSITSNAFTVMIEDVQPPDTGDTDIPGPPVATSLLISEVVDHANTTGARFVEIYNPANMEVSLEGWKVGRYANGGTTPTNIALTGTIPADDVFVLAASQTGFEAEYGAGVADQFNGTVTGNGDDGYGLIDPNGVLVDMFGELGVDGTGTAWEYEDGFATRLEVGVPTPIFNIQEWMITGGVVGTTPGQYFVNP